MTDTLRDKLINKGWVTPFNADTLVRLIEEHYAELAKPVQVSERLPGPKDCLPWPGDPDEARWCWVFIKGPFDDDSWERRPVICLTTYKSVHSYWLPAHALPLPGQEVEG